MTQPVERATVRARFHAEPCCAETPAERRLFFKYMPRETARIVLKNRTLRWRRPGTFNDPFDVQFDLNIHADFEAIKGRYINAFWDKHFAGRPRSGPFWEHVGRSLAESYNEGVAGAQAMLPQTNRELRAAMANEKIICFANTPYSLPMWSYYAEEHYGVVLCLQSIPGGDSPYVIAQPVNYKDGMPSLYEGDEFFRTLTREHSLDQKQIVHRLVYTKAKSWEHEGEWRIRQGDGRHPEAIFEDNSFDERELAAVLFGCRMPSQERAEFVEICQNFPAAELYQMVKSEKTFELIMSALA